MSDDDDVVRQGYRALNDDEKAQVKKLKEIGQEFIWLCNDQGRSRELSLAITNIEQAVMWAVKHMTR